jgi:hypothetical protein
MKKPDAATEPPFALPKPTDPEFAALPPKVRREVALWAKRLARIWHIRPITGAIRELARVCDVSYGNALRRYYRMRASDGDWRVLINRSEVPVMPLTVRMPLRRCGFTIKVISHGPHEVLIQVQRTPQQGKGS